jgi:hypothetical protein
MSLSRPKRKATANKSYNDTLEEVHFEEDGGDQTVNLAVQSPVSPVKRKYTRKIQPTTTSKSDPKITVPYNWQPPPSIQDYFSKKLNLTDAYIDLSSQTLYCPFHTSESRVSPIKKSKPIFYLSKGDYIYMISEPPGEPYYVGRIMGFTTKKKFDDEKDAIVSADDYMFKIQWFYRPRDISKSTSDSRLLFASMHSDTCPFISYRGLITVRHKQDIENEYELTKQKTDKKPTTKKSSSPSNSLSVLEMYSQQPDCFYFDKLFDRYMIKFYEIILTEDLLKYADSDDCKSKHFLKALNKRFEFIFVEGTRAKSLFSTFSSSSCNCEKCGLWCDSPQDTINCVVCKKYYHMYCLDPPLLKKPSRGFSWACAFCTKEQEIQYQSKRIIMLSHDNKSSNEKELTTELSALSSPAMDDTFSNSSANQSTTTSQDEEEEYDTQQLPNYEILAQEFLNNDKNLTFQDRRLKEEWCMRYLGMHARLEDALDLEDRNPYPRASTRLGAKHQATNVPEFEGHPIEYYDIERNSKKKLAVSKKKKSSDTIITKKLEVPKEFEDVPVKEYPQWLQPRPKGYIERGVDDGEGITNTLLWKPLERDCQDSFQTLDEYISQCSPVAEKLGLSPNSPNFVDAILLEYLKKDGDSKSALETVSKFTKKFLKEPIFNREEVKRFELGVRKYGSELHPVAKLVKSQPSSMVVRFYYLWKKTKNGKLIWGNYEGRRHKKLQNVVKDETKPDQMHIPSIDILADPDDDSSYEDDKIVNYEKKFACKHCNAHRSIKWFRITGHDANTEEKSETGEKSNSVLALCFRCARLWRRYAVEWESPEDVEKKTTKVTGWKKKVEAELLRDTEKIMAEAEAKGGVVSYDTVEGDVFPLETYTTPKEPKNPNKRVKKEVELFKNQPAPVPERESKRKNSKLEEPLKPVKVKKANIKVETPTKLSSNATSAKSKITKAPVKTPTQKAVTKGRPRVKKEKDVANPKEKLKSIKDQEKENGKEKDEKSKAKTEKIQGNKDEKPAKPKANPRKKKLKESEPVSGQDGASTSDEPPIKKQKKQPVSRGIIDWFINSNYTSSFSPDSLNVKQPDLELTELIAQDRRKAMTNFLVLSERIGASDQTQPNLLFPIDSRPCAVCFDKSDNTPDMLICFGCGVNVHEACGGLQIPDKVPRPVTEWLCETCVNDLKQIHSKDYVCTLCVNKETDSALCLTGSPSAKPDYLKPIYETGDWCHLLCAIFSSGSVEFKLPYHILQPKKLTKDDIFNRKVELINKQIAIESVSNVYLDDVHQKCGICQRYNGSLVKCDDCGTKFHVTCAQSNEKFRVGFKLVPTDKDSKLVKINELSGMLQPSLICSSHDSNLLFSFKTLAKRVNQKENSKPVIQLFLEDIRKGVSTKLSGPQLKSLRYFKRYNILNQEHEEENIESNQRISCHKCQSTISPIWRNDNQYSSLNVCQKCYHNQENNEPEETPVEDFIDLLKKPLDGKLYGIKDENDFVTNVASVNVQIPDEHQCSNDNRTHANSDHNAITDLPQNEPNRSKISLGDILV